MTVQAPEVVSVRGESADEVVVLGGPLASYTRPENRRDGVERGKKIPGVRVRGNEVTPLEWPGAPRPFNGVRAAWAEGATHVMWVTGSAHDSAAAPPTQMPSSAQNGGIPTLKPYKPPADSLWYAQLRDGTWGKPVLVWSGEGLRWDDHTPSPLVSARGELHLVTPIFSQRWGVLYVHGIGSRWSTDVRLKRLSSSTYLHLIVRPDGGLVVPAVTGVDAEGPDRPNSNSVVVGYSHGSEPKADSIRELYRSGVRGAHHLGLSSSATGRVTLFWMRYDIESTSPSAASTDGSERGAHAAAAPSSSAPGDIIGMTSADWGATWTPIASLRVPGIRVIKVVPTDSSAWVIADVEGSRSRVLAARMACGRWAVWTVWQTPQRPSLNAISVGATLSTRGVPRLIWTVVDMSELERVRDARQRVWSARGDSTRYRRAVDALAGAPPWYFTLSSTAVPTPR